jgi:chromosome segregation ATPase
MSTERQQLESAISTTRASIEALRGEVASVTTKIDQSRADEQQAENVQRQATTARQELLATGASTAKHDRELATARQAAADAYDRRHGLDALLAKTQIRVGEFEKLLPNQIRALDQFDFDQLVPRYNASVLEAAKAARELLRLDRTCGHQIWRALDGGLVCFVNHVPTEVFRPHAAGVTDGIARVEALLEAKAAQ